MSEIPEDLNDLYAWAILPKDVGELFPGFIRKRVKTLIERIGKLVQERDALKVQLARLSAPVSEEDLIAEILKEWQSMEGEDDLTEHAKVAILCVRNARAAEQKEGV